MDNFAPSLGSTDSINSKDGDEDDDSGYRFGTTLSPLHVLIEVSQPHYVVETNSPVFFSMGENCGTERLIQWPEATQSESGENDDQAARRQGLCSKPVGLSVLSHQEPPSEVLLSPQSVF